MRLRVVCVLGPPSNLGDSRLRHSDRDRGHWDRRRLHVGTFGNKTSS